MSNENPNKIHTIILKNNWKIQAQYYVSKLYVKTNLNRQLFANSGIIRTAIALNYHYTDEVLHISHQQSKHFIFLR